MSDAIIRTENLTKTYGSGQVTTHALRGVSLEIPRGAFCAIVGPSGHGKSTLMHLVGGLDRPSAGQVTVDGIELTGLANSDLARLRAEKIGFVFQFFNLLGSLTAEENVAAAMMFAGIPEKRQKERARELLELVGLGEKLGARPRQLSGGQQQRVAIARALANDPDILLMDEPTGNLDSAAEAEVLAAVAELHRQGKTVVIVTHNPEIARQAQMVVEIRDGRLASA
ncbi:ABC transporter ATP-binding protein [Geobacter sulfurreducens]|uniref:ABC transporter ATP-binding protein n=1 Tax=Geobacter sulfurreducens TaxID=35554 RepID=UPI000DBBA0CF|nr:ABC transporter ATP-binding protein [Geobacter sulfurreducens]BBA69212.1 Macrolide export ATP-binding/permease protein MacB [Geobacter sulfurreducens]HML80092.1 ABC transporter ATP-binding protein [Geobacter sulfurreducens]